MIKKRLKGKGSKWISREEPTYYFLSYSALSCSKTLLDRSRYHNQPWIMKHKQSDMKQEEIRWRRDKILELSSRGSDEREIASTLQISPATAHQRHCLSMLAARKTSMPAPEPKSTTVSPSLIKANFVGVPHPAPRIDASGKDFKSWVS